MGGEQLVSVGPTTDICVQTFGNADDPAVLLIAGAASSMDWWQREFCEHLADGPRFVIRYDHRDTGRSTSSPAGAATYTGDDLATDPIAILDALGIGRAHLVGVSMGGGIAQQLALEHPSRVASLTLIATSPVNRADPAGRPLPGVRDDLRARFEDPPPDPDWSDRAAVIDYLVDEQRAFAGAALFEEATVRSIAADVVDRTGDIEAASKNHWAIAGGSDGDAPLPPLSGLGVPTVILHGTDDPLFPFAHGEALAAEIPGARLVRLDGMGHEMPPRATWELAIPAILRVTSGSWDEQADRLAARSLADGDPTGWFDRLYREASDGAVDMPWDRTDPHPLLREWVERTGLDGRGGRAVVVGCGLGADAAYVATLGFDTIGFDVSETAVALAAERFVSAGLEFRAASLFELPADWQHAFDLVVEIFTVQALPRDVRTQAIEAVASLVRPGGRLLAVGFELPDGASREVGPPWPLTTAEIASFATGGLVAERIETVVDPASGRARWRAEFART